MSFRVSWHTLLEELDELPDGTELITPLSHDRFRIVDVQQHRVLVTDSDTEDRRPLQRDQFETLWRRVRNSDDGFELDRLPADAAPYPAVLSCHPRFEIVEDRCVIVEKEAVSDPQLIADDTDVDERTESDGIDVYSDALLLIDALERHEMEEMGSLETEALVNVYTLCSDVQRNANGLRRTIADVLLDRIHHDQPLSGQYGSVQRTSRRDRSLKDEQLVLTVLEEAGIDRERVTSVDSSKVSEALEVTEIAESDVYHVSERQYVRKTEVDEAIKESRLQGLKDRLAGNGGAESRAVRREIGALEERIDDLTGFSAGTRRQP